MIVEVVYFDFLDLVLCLMLLNLYNSGLEPTREGMEGVNSMVDLQFPSRFPLGEDAFGVDADVFIEPGRPSRVVDVEISALDEYDLSVDPFLRGIENVDALAEVELVGDFLSFHS
jgi:hypothetical protein